MDLSEFLLARIAEDEAAARAVAEASQGAWAALPVGLLGLARHMSHVNFLTECDAKRRIVELHTESEPGPHECPGRYSSWSIAEGDPCPTLRLFATAYADHQGYDPEWKP